MASGGFLVVALLAVLVVLALGGFVASAGLLAALLINSLVGILVLALLGFLGLHIPINILTVLVVVLFGLAGVALLSILAFLDIYGDETITAAGHRHHV